MYTRVSVLTKHLLQYKLVGGMKRDRAVSITLVRCPLVPCTEILKIKTEEYLMEASEMSNFD